VKVKKALGAIPTKSKEEEESILAHLGAALVPTLKKMIKNLGKTAQLKAPMIKYKKMIKKIITIRKMIMVEKIAKV
jgi:hypothetical protein